MYVSSRELAVHARASERLQEMQDKASELQERFTAQEAQRATLKDGIAAFEDTKKAILAEMEKYRHDIGLL